MVPLADAEAARYEALSASEREQKDDQHGSDDDSRDCARPVGADHLGVGEVPAMTRVPKAEGSEPEVAIASAASEAMTAQRQIGSRRTPSASRTQRPGRGVLRS